MRRTLGITVAWLGATILAVVVAAAAVGSVRSQVTESPTALGSPAVATLALDTATEAAPGPETEPQTTVTRALAPQGSESTTETTTPKEVVPASSTSTTSPGVDNPTTSTTSPPQPSTPTTTAPAQEYKTFDTVAGSVRVIVRGNSVTFGGAFPKPGWSVELEKAGPKSVEVKFEANDEGDEIEFHAEIEDGELKVSISEE